MIDWLHVSMRWLHLTAAVTWIGGMMFVVLVLVPIVKAEFPPEKRVQLVAAVGRRFRVVGWVSLTILILTGFYNLWEVSGPGFMSNKTYLSYLTAKLVLVLIVLTLSILHDFYYGPRLENFSADPSQGTYYRKLQQKVVLLARVHLLLALAVLLLAKILTG
ncbi:MAG: DUF4149 domain-containing protein [Armatimonadetes bacterium]|nr:DUF4149 domain-containing protein [Armatimonadota bacterium]